MKPSNVIKSFESGWLVGLSSGSNRVLVQTPTGEVFHPYEGPGHKMFGTTIDNATVSVVKEVAAFVRHLWEKREEVRECEQAAQEDEIEKLARELTGEDEEGPTLGDLGFTDGDSIQIEDV